MTAFVGNRGLFAALVFGFTLLLGAGARDCAAAIYTLGPDQQVVGQEQTITTVYQDSLYDIARRYGVDSVELIRLNAGVDPWVPGAGKTIHIPGRHILPPGPHEGIVVNVPEHRLYYYPKHKRGQPQQVITYPVSIGKMDWQTPLGLTRVISKQKDPAWYPTASVRQEHKAQGDPPLPAVVPAGPDNPLGRYAMRLAVGGGTYLIHGTNNPIAVGMAVTHGCIRMYPEDVEALYPQVPVGTPVRLINDPVKVAWVDGELLLEAHPPVDKQGQSFEPDVGKFSDLLQAAVGDSTVAINWDYAHEVLKQADGMLATVGLEADLSGESAASASVGAGAGASTGASATSTAGASAATDAAGGPAAPPGAAAEATARGVLLTGAAGSRGD